MKMILTIFSIFIFFSAMVEAAELKVLCVGNSFASSVIKDLRAIARAEGCNLKIFAFTCLPGASMEEHLKNAKQEEANPELRCYQLTPAKKAKMREILTMEKWDIITIQQFSRISYMPETYFPWAEELSAYIRRYAPQAEIIFQQTWRFREDHGIYKNGKLSPLTMYERLTDAYREAATKLSLRVIPAGAAIELALAKQAGVFRPLSKEQSLSPAGTPVPEPYALHEGWIWKKTNSSMNARFDGMHLNERGKYLQACVWYGFLFKKDPETIRWKPSEMDLQDAIFLKMCAKEALQNGLDTVIKR